MQYVAGRKRPVISLNELARAIMHETSVTVKDAEETALVLLNIFGFETRIVDNVLDNSERSLIRTLEDAHLIKTEREDCILEDGRDWHMHFWTLNYDAIKSVTKKFEDSTECANCSPKYRSGELKAHSVEKGPDGGAAFIYAKIPDEAWSGSARTPQRDRELAVKNTESATSLSANRRPPANEI